jgi:hypothetical protein
MVLARWAGRVWLRARAELSETCPCPCPRTDGSTRPPGFVRASPASQECAEHLLTATIEKVQCCLIDVKALMVEPHFPSSTRAGKRLLGNSGLGTGSGTGFRSLILARALRLGFCAVALGAALTATACSDDYDSCEATRTCPSAAGRSGSAGASGSAGSGPGGASGSTSGSGGTTSGMGGTAGESGGTTGADSGIDGPMEDGGGSGGLGGADAGPDSFDPTVRGVLKSAAGFPAPGITVAIGNSVATTDSNGGFVIADAPPSYDLLILRSTQQTKYVETYVALTTRRPTVTFTSAPDVGRTAAVNGTIEPPDAFPLGPSQMMKFAFYPPSIPVWNPVDVFEPKVPPLTVNWQGNETITGQICALQWTTGAGGLPASYQRWGSQALALADQATVSTTLRIGAVGQQEAAGTVRLPLQNSSVEIQFWVSNILLGQQQFPTQPSANTAPYRFPVPTGLGVVPKMLQFQTVLNAGRSTVLVQQRDSTPSLDVDLGPPPTAATPVDSATNVDTNTEFAWSAVPNAVYSLIVYSAGTIFRVHTPATRAKVPDTLPKGIPFAAGGYQWYVQARGPARGTDDLVNGTMPVDQQEGAFTNESFMRQFTR